jgi:hypothetical protein
MFPPWAREGNPWVGRRAGTPRRGHEPAQTQANKKRARILLEDSQADAYIARLVFDAGEIRWTDVFGREHPDALFHVADR